MSKNNRRTNITMPKQMDKLLDILLQHPDVKKAGIRDRNQLAAACLNIFTERLSKLERKQVEVKTGNVNVTLSADIKKKVDDAAKRSPVARYSLWLQDKTNIFRVMLFFLLIEYVAEFREYSSLIKVTADDLKSAMETKIA